MAEMLEPVTLAEEGVRENWDVADGSPAEADGTPEPRERVDEDRKGYELIHGTWVEKTEMGLEAATVTNFLQEAITTHVRRIGLGTVAGSEGGYQLFPNAPKLVRKPDISFVAAGRFPGGKVPRGNAKLAPDLAVEVVSPNDGCEAQEQKLDEYLRAGVRLVWVVYPNTRAVYVYRPDGTAARKTAAESLDGESVLPGLTIPVADLFVGL